MKHFLLFGITIAILFASVVGCNKNDDDPAPPPTPDDGIPSELLQTWKSVTVGGKQIVTDSTIILQMQNPQTAYVQERRVYDSVPVWQTMRSVVTYSNDTLTINGHIDNPVENIVLTYLVMKYDDSSLKMKLLKKYVNGQYRPDNTVGQETVFEAVATNVDARIAGMWKANPKSGQTDTFGLYFKTAGQYDYYYYNAQGGSSIKNDNDGFYWFYGDFIVLHYKNAPYTQDQKEYVDCWNVKIVESNDESNPKTMTFTALESNGLVETETFKYLGVQ